MNKEGNNTQFSRRERTRERGGSPVSPAWEVHKRRRQEGFPTVRNKAETGGFGKEPSTAIGKRARRDSSDGWAEEKEIR